MDTVKESSLVTKDIHVDSLIPGEDNPNHMTQGQLDRLVEEIKDLGCIDPIDVIPLSDGRYEILGGEHRWKASRMAGLTYVPCVIHNDAKWSDRKNVNLQRFKLNALRGKMGGPAFIKLYKQVCDDVGPEKAQHALAVSDQDEWKKLTKSIVQSLKDQGASDQVLDEVKEAEAKAKNPQELSKKLDKILKKYSNAIQSNVIVFQNGASENVILKANQQTFECMKAISQCAIELGKDINEFIGPCLVELLGKIKTG